MTTARSLVHADAGRFRGVRAEIEILQRVPHHCDRTHDLRAVVRWRGHVHLPMHQESPLAANLEPPPAPDGAQEQSGALVSQSYRRPSLRELA